MNYLDEYQQSIEQPELFWRKLAEQIKWYEFPETILSQDEHGFYRWFTGGKLNTAYLALDVHIEEGHGDQLALVYDSPATNSQRKFNYTELRDEVAIFAGGLKNLGVGIGDRVLLAHASGGHRHQDVLDRYDADDIVNGIAIHWESRMGMIRVNLQELL